MKTVKIVARETTSGHPSYGPPQYQIVGLDGPAEVKFGDISIECNNEIFYIFLPGEKHLLRGAYYASLSNLFTDLSLISKCCNILGLKLEFVLWPLKRFNEMQPCSICKTQGCIDVKPYILCRKCAEDIRGKAEKESEIYCSQGRVFTWHALAIDAIKEVIQ